MGATTRRQARFWVGAVASGVSATALLLTLLRPSWIEALAGARAESLDGGDGSLEWVVVIGSAVVAITAAALARRDWRAAHRPLPD